MATRERREEYSSNVVRVLHPTRPLSPGSNMSDVDTNLDYLLEDLQSTVKPESSFGNTANYSSSSRDVQYLSPANSTTIIKERSVSPTSNEKRTYKSASYQYSTSTGQRPTASVSSQQNVNQLDALLQDLKNEREVTTRNKDYSLLSSSSNIDSSLLEPGTTVTKTTRVYSSSGDKPSVQRELFFDSPDHGVKLPSDLRQKSPSYVKSIETKTVKDVSFEPSIIEPEPVSVQNTINKFNYSNTTENRVSPYTRTVTVDTAALPEDLKGVPLSDDILPVPGTKVTTTVRTYTYEIPADPAPVGPGSKTLLYKNESYNTTNTSSYPEREVPPSVVFKTESYNTVDTTDGTIPRREPHPVTTSTKTVVHKTDTRETTSNLYPGPRNDYPPHSRPRDTSPQPGNTVIYKQEITNTSNTNVLPPNGPRSPGYLNQSPQYPLQPAQPGHPGHPGQPGPTTTYYYKKESSNTTNTLYGPPGSGSPNDRYPPITYPDRSPQDYSPRSPGYPNEPNTTVYKYSSHTTTTNTHGSPSEREPLLQPGPFPVDGIDSPGPNDTPPKRLDDLLASFGNTQNGKPVADEPYVRKREVETAVATSGKPIAAVEPKVPSKNIAGPPVYYPPGHEMFARKEESGAAYRAQGGYARGAGRYEYEAESKSKSKSKSGATMVPVCLPLCCAMPCSIM